MGKHAVRLATRAVIVHDGRLLLVNAWANGQSRLLCAPGGGVLPGTSLPDNLAREVHEETGLTISVGTPCLVNEFHDPRTGFHQVDLFFRCSIVGSAEISKNWQDPERIVTQHVWARETDIPHLWLKPDSLARVAFSAEAPAIYDAFEEIVK
ncbi:NUDIX domain-containing protein [uncultured Roseobacter sp.]|uniref:NUDIX domain-containing protein n=1 Tax=uncultured Roseobacter sp. TaxID=114847 RepID=UPI002613DE5C|nr:NUDIX domain-containing protein [uncultured Roseobacter sp.]